MALSIHRPFSRSLRRGSRAQPARGPLKVAMFTTSYPRDAADLAGRFVFNTVEHLRDRQVEIEVVAPGSYRDFGLTGAGNGGVVRALKRRPWLAALLLLSMIAACRAAARPASGRAGLRLARSARRALRPRRSGRARLEDGGPPERRARSDGTRQDRGRDSRRRDPDPDRGRAHGVPRSRRRRGGSARNA